MMKNKYWIIITVAVIMIPAMAESTSDKNTFQLSSIKAFLNHNNSVYWHALMQLAKNNKEAALAILAAADGGNANVPSLAFDAMDSIETYFDKLFIYLIYRDPQSLSYLGLFESIGVNDHNAYLNDLSIQMALDDVRVKKECLDALKKYEQSSLTEPQATSYSIIAWMLEHAVAGEQFIFHDYKVNQMFGVLSDLASTFTRYHRLESMSDVELYLSRLEKIPQQLQEVIAILEHQKNQGIVTPSFALEKVINSIKKTIPQEIAACFLYAHLADACRKLQEDSAQILSRAQNILQEQVYPAYQLLLEYCQALHGDSCHVNGVWALPHGDDYYAYCLARHTTTALTADEIHELGIKEVAAIQHAMREIFAHEGIIDEHKTVGELLQHLARDARFYFPNTAQGRMECIAHYEAILERCRSELYPLFDIKPKVPVSIQAVPAHEEEGMPGAYYVPPSMDGSRPGTFYANLRNLAELPIYGMETLTVHEAEPGHHFQIALQQEMDMPMVRKLGEFTAYVEGWALYAEKLAYEQNFYSSSWAQLGHLQDELLRAVRLVVDTGIHKKRWTREQAIEYMVHNTGYHRNAVITEVERYFVLPGQACAYKIGQLKILELRKRALDKLQEKFDIREFHNEVLMLGAAPLTVLEQVIDQYICRKGMVLNSK